MKKGINHIFICTIICFLLLGLVSTIFFPKEINTLENRYAYKIPNFTIEEFYKGTFQSQVSDALNDQVPLASAMKKTYNYLNSLYENKILSLFVDESEGKYITYKGGLKFRDFVVYEYYDFSMIKESVDLRVSNIIKQVENNPNVDFYVYYIEKDTDINFETNQKTEVSGYLLEEFLKKEVPFSTFVINDFEEFSKYFYKTDHHWNCYGSYKAYGEILELLGINESVVTIENEYILDYDFSGSKTAAIGASEVIMEKFPVYEYSYPDMTICIDGQSTDDYGLQDEYMSYQIETITYGDYYGGDNAEIIFDTQHLEKENLLIIGESYDNAILKLLASHFNKTYSIDLRNYEATFGKKFSFSKYVEENDIDKVLLIGNVDYFTMESFMLED